MKGAISTRGRTSVLQGVGWGMFEQSFLPADKKLKSWTMLGAFAGHSLLAGALMMVPVFLVEEAPAVKLTRFLVAPPLPPPPARAAVHYQAAAPATRALPAPRTDEMPLAAETVKPAKLVARQFDMARLAAPRTVPDRAAILDEPPEVQLSSANGGGVDGGVPGGVPGGVAGGVPGGVLGGITGLPAAPEPERLRPAPVPSPKRIRVGGNVQRGRITRKVVPNYPEIARVARVQGVVHLTAVIDEDGRITDVEVVSGHPLLVGAAVSAVKKWRYTPTLLNGEPVEVVTDIEVRFVLH